MHLEWLVVLVEKRAFPVAAFCGAARGAPEVVQGDFVCAHLLLGNKRQSKKSNADKSPFFLGDGWDHRR